MLKIAVCDDSPRDIAAVAEQLRRLEQELDIRMEIASFQSAESLLVAYPQHADLLILDVQMGEMSGIELAQTIRRQDKAVSIIFMSSYLQYAVEGYSVSAFRYLLKPISQTQFDHEVRDLLVCLERDKQKTILLKTRNAQYAAAPQDILYIETLPEKHLRFHFRNDHMDIPGLIGTWEKQLASQPFLRAHNAYLINLSYIRKIEGDCVLLTSGETLPVSRRRKKELSDAFCLYLMHIH